MKVDPPQATQHRETLYRGGHHWFGRDGSTYGVRTDYFTTREEADAETRRMALEAGYTPPKWWEWWRWNERELP